MEVPRDSGSAVMEGKILDLTRFGDAQSKTSSRSASSPFTTRSAVPYGVRVRSGLAVHDTSGSYPSYEVSSGIRQPNRVRA